MVTHVLNFNKQQKLHRKQETPMLRSISEVEQSIISGDILEYRNSGVELKQSWSREDGQKISALANGFPESTCWMCVGVNDNGKLSNQDEKWAKNSEEQISQHVNQYLDPPQTCKEIHCVKFGEYWAIVLEIGCPGAAVYWNKEAYRTSGTTKIKMTNEQVLGLTLKLPGLQDFTNQVCSVPLQKQASIFLASRLAEREESIDSITSLESACRVFERYELLNKQALRLLCGSGSFRIVRMKDEKVLLNETRSPLADLLRDEFILEIQEWGSHNLKLDSDIEPYSRIALREAITNAVAHSVFHQRDGDIVVEQTPEQISISNLCTSDSGYFANRWFSRGRLTQNPLIVEVLRCANLMDELGLGKSKIIQEAMKSGTRAPWVNIEPAGRYSRWTLFLSSRSKSTQLEKLYEQLLSRYGDKMKAALAQALVLWSNIPFSQLAAYLDSSTIPLVKEILEDLAGPVFYHKEENKLIPNRWVLSILGHGKDVHQLSEAEEKQLKEFAYKYCMEHEAGVITPRRLRYLGNLGETPSAKTMSSKLLSKWQQAGIVQKIQKGKYRFIDRVTDRAELEIAIAYLKQGLLNN